MADKKLFVYGALAIAVAGFLVILGGGGSIIGMIGAMLSAIGAVAAILFIKYDYLFIPLITQRTKTVTVNEGNYEISPTGDSIAKERNGVYYASTFLQIKIFESTTTKSPEEVLLYNEAFERAISNLRNVTKIAFMLYIEDITEKRRMIEAKKSEAQQRVAKERETKKQDVVKMDVMEREVAAWGLQLEELSKGPKPMGLMAYAMTTANGSSKEEAMAVVKAQASELRTTLKNSLNVEIEILTDEDMMKCFEWKLFYPTSPTDLEQTMTQ